VPGRSSQCTARREEVTALAHQGPEKRTQTVWVLARSLDGPEPHLAMEVPGHDEDRTLSILDSLGKGGEVGVASMRNAARDARTTRQQFWPGIAICREGASTVPLAEEA
jgi:hypothetical protein